MKASLSQQLFVLPAYFLTSIIEECIQDRIYKESNYVKSQITKVHLFMTNKGKVIRINSVIHTSNWIPTHYSNQNVRISIVISRKLQKFESKEKLLYLISAGPPLSP